MRRYQDKRPALYRGWRRIVYSWPALAVLLLLVLLLGRATWRVSARWGQVRNDALQARARYQETEERFKELGEEVKRLGTERGLEEELRRNFPVAKPGEEVVIIVDSKATTSR